MRWGDSAHRGRSAHFEATQRAVLRVATALAARGGTTRRGDDWLPNTDTARGLSRRTVGPLRRRLRVGLALLSVASIGGVALVAALGSVEPNTLSFEIAKTILQVGVVLAAGALLSLLTSDYQKDQEKAESRQELLRNILGRAGVAYNDVKRARRLLRAHAMTEDGTAIIASAYDVQIAAINDAQLQFETLADEIQGAFPELAGTVAREFDLIEESRNALVREYEDNRRNFAGGPLALGNRAPARSQEILGASSEGRSSDGRRSAIRLRTGTQCVPSCSAQCRIFLQPRSSNRRKIT